MGNSHGSGICIDSGSMGRPFYVCHSAISPQAVAEMLSNSIDEERWTLFSLSGYESSRPILGQVGENAFRSRKTSQRLVPLTRY